MKTNEPITMKTKHALCGLLSGLLLLAAVFASTVETARAALYAGSYGTNIEKIDSTTGADLGSFASGFSGQISLAFDSAGNLYAADSGSTSIRVITPSGVIGLRHQCLRADQLSF
jgi:hypothetical protein